MVPVVELLKKKKLNEDPAIKCGPVDASTRSALGAAVSVLHDIPSAGQDQRRSSGVRTLLIQDYAINVFFS